MQQRELGRQGLSVSALGYGAMGTVVGYGPAEDAESITAIRRAHELGVTHFDTAEMYGWGEGEQLLGAALQPIRGKVTIATKFGLAAPFGQNSRPAHVREVVEASLTRLGVDHIDLLYQHFPDPEVPVEEVVGVMAEFVEAGKVRYLGLSNADAEYVRVGHAVHPISAVQSEYSLFARGTEQLLPTLEELGIGLVAYSPLARGFLGGAVRPRSEFDADDFRHHIDWWDPESYPANLRMVEQLTALAQAKGATLSQLALAWLLSRGDFLVPIPGSRNPDRVAQNTAAAELELTAEDLARIAEIVPEGGISRREY